MDIWKCTEKFMGLTDSTVLITAPRISAISQSQRYLSSSKINTKEALLLSVTGT